MMLSIQKRTPKFFFGGANGNKNTYWVNCSRFGDFAYIEDIDRPKKKKKMAVEIQIFEPLLLKQRIHLF